MRKDDSLSFGFITVAELMKIDTKDTNRCGELTKNDALAKGFKEGDWNSYITRAKKILKNIEKNGYSPSSLIRIAKCSEDGKYYLIDGQGRRMAVKMYVEKGGHINEVPCLMYNKEMNFSEIDKAIKDLNTGNTNWKTDDLIRSVAIEMGGDTEAAFNIMEDYKDSFVKHGLSITPYMAKYVFFGEKASHIRSDNTSELSTKNFRTFYDVYSNEYRRFVVNASYLNNELRTGDARNKVKNQDFAIGIMQVLVSICKTAMEEYKSVEKARPIVEKEVASFIDKMLEKCEGMNDERLVQEINLSANVGGKFDKKAILTRFLKMNKGNNFVKKYLMAA